MFAIVTMKSKKAVLFLLCAFAFPAYGGSAAASAGPAAAGVDERLGKEVPADIVLYDESGRKVLLGSLIDKPTILLPAYYGCPNVCATSMADLSNALGRLESAPGESFSVITVSFDERDTPADALRKKKNCIKAVERSFPDTAWRFLTGDRDNILKLTEALGYGFKRVEKGFTHPSALVILSPERKIIRYVYGGGYLAAELEMAFNEARSGTVAPTIPRALLFCFTYDAARNRLVFDFVKLTGAGVVMGAAVFLIYLTRRKKKDE